MQQNGSVSTVCVCVCVRAIYSRVNVRQLKRTNLDENCALLFHYASNNGNLGYLALEDETDNLSLNVGKKLPLLAT